MDLGWLCTIPRRPGIEQFLRMARHQRHQGLHNAQVPQECPTAGAQVQRGSSPIRPGSLGGSTSGINGVRLDISPTARTRSPRQGLCRGPLERPGVIAWRRGTAPSFFPDAAYPPYPLSMLLQPLAQRHRQPEWMDQPGIDPAAHSQALEGLRRINAISGAVGSLWAPIRALAQERSGRPLRVLDLACGGGDNTTALAERARREGLAVRVDGCDLSPQAVAIATRSAEERGLNTRFFQADALHDSLPDDYDVILCTLFLHHLEEDEAVDLLRRMGGASRCLMLVNDLIRSPLGYGLAWAGCRLLSRSPIVHFDGPVSVQGAFQLQEVRALVAQAGLKGAELRRSWPERYLLSWRRQDGLPQDR